MVGSNIISGACVFHQVEQARRMLMTRRVLRVWLVTGAVVARDKDRFVGTVTPAHPLLERPMLALRIARPIPKRAPGASLPAFLLAIRAAWIHFGLGR